MKNFLNAIKREMVIHFEFYGDYPHARIGWVWILIGGLLGWYWFGGILSILMVVTIIVNFLNRR